jgi:hypothetical protein
MKKLKRVVKDQAGFALPMALVLMLLGGMILVPSAALMGSTLKSNRVVDEIDDKLYAADAGMEHAIYELMYDETFTRPPVGEEIAWQLGEELNDATVDVTMSREDRFLYKITSTATADDGSTLTIEAYPTYGYGGISIFDNALVSLEDDVTVDNNAVVRSREADGTYGTNGDIYSNGDINLAGQSVVDGYAYAAGVVTGDGVPSEGQMEGADPLDMEAAENEMAEIIAGWVDEATAITCATCSTSYTRTTNPTWNAPTGTYLNNEYVQYGMTIDGTSGTWNFMETVCVGASTAGTLTIAGKGDTTFHGPVKVGGDLLIPATGGSVIFKDSVCVDGNLIPSGGGVVIFEGMVKVGGNLSFQNDQDAPVQFDDCLWVVGDIAGGANKADIILGGSTYVEGSVNILNNNYINGGQNIVVDGDIRIGNGSGLNYGVALDAIPFLISTGGNIVLENNAATTWAILYALGDLPDAGHIDIMQNVELVGSAVGREVHANEGSMVTYPIEFRSRTDLPGSGGGSPPVGLHFNSYTVNP